MPASIGRGLGVAEEVVVLGDGVAGAWVTGGAVDVALGGGVDLPAQEVAAANVTNASEANKSLLTGQAPRPMSA
jgi:hypothetical protein